MTNTTTQDQLQVFIFDSCPVRGEIVSISESWQTILARKSYPAPVRQLLGDLVAAGVLLSGTLKFNGSLIIQAQGHGPIQLLVMECNADLSMRATAKFDENYNWASQSDYSLKELLNPQGGGQLVITLDPADRQPGQQPYQGIVALHDGHEAVKSIAQAIMLYMKNSEQLDTRIWLASDERSCGGLLIQRLPDHGGQQQIDANLTEESWQRLQALSDTVSHAELLTIAPKDLMRRLFLEESHHHGVRSFDPRNIWFACRCSRLKVADMLKMLGESEINSILDEQGQVESRCEFCGQNYLFDAVDCKQVFSAANLTDGIARPPEAKQ